MLKSLFRKESAPAMIDKGEFYRRLGLENKGFQATPRHHPAIIRYAARSFSDLVFRDTIGPCQTYYADPAREGASTALSFTTEVVSIDKINFSLVISGDSAKLEKDGDRLIFAMAGYYAPDAPMAVTKIIAPIKGEGKALGPSREIGVSQETLQKAMVFAENCAKSLYETGKIDIQACFDLADRAEIGIPKSPSSRSP